MINTDIDRASFADSDQFDDDSVNSWISESEDQINNWRGWRRTIQTFGPISKTHSEILYNQPEKLLNQAAKIVAAIQPGFDLTVHGSPFPEELIKLVASYSFPNSEEEIRLYSCLGCGNVDEFIRGENLYKTKSVKECLQIGFHLSAKVLRRPINSQPNNEGTDSTPQYDNGFSYSQPVNTNIDMNTNSKPTINNRQMNSFGIPGQSLYNNNICKVSVTFDRGRITSCNCSCDFLDCVDKVWCSHVVAACLYRIHEAKTIQIRTPISESLSKLNKEDLQKFAQFLISKMNLADILPAAQNILDELLASDNNQMKSIRGAPDLTAGASLEDNPMWFFDHVYIEENISKILQKFCVPKPVVYGDPRHLSNNLPMVAQEYQNILRPMRGKEPEGIWNLISIIRDMFRREDSNALCLLRILTKCLLQSKPIMMWWYCIKLNQDWCLKTNSQSSNSLHSQYASAYFCDEMVQLWRIAALRYSLSSCNFVTTRRLPVHRADQTGENIADLMNEIKGLHETVIKTAISCLDKPPSRTVINYASNMINSSNSRHPTVLNNGLSSSSPINNLQPCSTSLIHEDTQRQFIGFKPAFDACKISITIQNQSNEINCSQGVTMNSDMVNTVSGMIASHTSLNNTGWNSEGYYDMDSVMNQSDNSMDTDIVVNEFDIDYDVGGNFLASTLFDNIKKEFEDVDLRYAKCESLFYHGYPNESTQLAYELSEDLLSRKSEICDRLYRSARKALIATHQKLNEYNQTSHTSTSNQPPSQTSQLHGRSTFPNHTKKRFRFHNATNTGLSPSVSTNGKLSDDFVDADQCYEPLTLMKQIQFLVTCLVNDSNGVSNIPQPQRSLMPSKSRLIEVAFHLLIFALQLPRKPAPYHNIEISMIQLEIDLISQAQQIKWRDYVLNFKQLLVNIALQLKNRSLPYMTEIHVPYNLASFVFEQLNGISGLNSQESLNIASVNRIRQKTNIRDRTKGKHFMMDNLDSFSNTNDCNTFDPTCDYGFEGALSVLGMKSKIPEQVNPLLVEGQRRLRDELSAFLFNVYKDDVDRLTLILSQLLDPILNPHFKAAPLKFYLQNPLNKMLENIDDSEQSVSSLNRTYFISPRQSNGHLPTRTTNQVQQDLDISKVTISPPTNTQYSSYIPTNISQSPPAVPVNVGAISELPSSTLFPSNLPITQRSSKLHSPQSKTSKTRPEKASHSIDTDSSALEDDNSETSIADKKIWEQKLRCFTTSKRLTNNHSTGMAAIDSSAPETTESSDNSPTTIRKRIFRTAESNQLYNIMADGIPCGGELENNNVTEEKELALESKEDDVVVSESTQEIKLKEATDQMESSQSLSLSTSSSPQMSSSPPLLCELEPFSKSPKTSPLQSKESLDSISNDDLKTDTNSYFIDEKLDVAECITESLAHHMFELAQTVLQRAGIPDDSSTPVFRVNNATSSVHNSNQHSSGSNHLAQRNLQLCAFQLGLYALGLYNHLNSLWQSRTYSSHVAWITTQVVDFGVSAACVLLHCWRHHLNPSEVAEIAYRVSKRRDTHMSRVGSELCLAVLAESSTLNPTQIVRGLRQCGDQSNEILERGLLSVESGANNSLSGVQPIIYFHLAQAWFQLHRNEVGPNITSSSSNTGPQNNSSNGTSTSANTSPYPSVINQVNNNSIHNLVISQTTQIPTVPFTPSNFGSAISLANHSPTGNQAWIYGNLLNGQGVNTSTQIGPFLSQFHLMPIRGLSAPSPPYNHNISARQIYFYQPTSISPHQLQAPHPGSNFSPQLHMIPNCTSSNWSLNQSSNVTSGVILSPTTTLSPIPSNTPSHSNGDNRAHDYLLRAFNSAMKAIHILFQIHTSTNVVNDSPTSSTVNNVTAANSRRPIIFNSPASVDINDYPTSTSSESQSSHDSNIKWTLKLARLLGAEEVNRYCMLIFQFIHNPFLMKEIIVEVMEFYNLSKLNIPSDFASTVSSGSINLLQNPLVTNHHHNAALLSGARQQGMVLPLPQNYAMMRSNTNMGFPSVTGITLHNLPNYNSNLQNGHAHNSYNLSIPLNSTQTGVELVHKLVNRLHYLFRRLIEKRLQQTGQGPRDWDMLVELILEAYRAQCALPASDPSLNWVEIMQKIKTNRKCTKDLWARIYAGLQTLDQI